jgi:hypothetical protein
MGDTWISELRKPLVLHQTRDSYTHVQFGEDSLLTQESLVKQALIVQGIQATDRKI